MDKLMKKSHSVFDICDGLHRGCCGWCFNHGGLRWSGDATVSLRGLPKPTLVSGKVYMYINLIYGILILKFYTYYVFNVYMYYKKEH